jgi:hypothetical protein
MAVIADSTFQAGAHFFFALIALEAFGFGVTGLHLVLLRGCLGGLCAGAFGAEAFFHESFALIAAEAFGFGVFVALAHFAFRMR